MTICGSSADKAYKKITESIEINRPADLALGKRIYASITASNSSFYVANLGTSHGSSVILGPHMRKLNYKIGIVDNKEILKNIRDNKSGAYEDLLTYAKEAESYISDGQVEIYPTKQDYEDDILNVKLLDPIYSQSEVEANKYYFLYLQMDTEEGKYYDLEDIYVLGATEASNGKIELVGKDEIEWVGLEDQPKKTKKSPKTGVASYTTVALGISIIAILIYFKMKKVTKFPQS